MNSGSRVSHRSARTMKWINVAISANLKKLGEQICALKPWLRRNSEKEQMSTQRLPYEPHGTQFVVFSPDHLSSTIVLGTRVSFPAAAEKCSGRQDWVWMMVRKKTPLGAARTQGDKNERNEHNVTWVRGRRTPIGSRRESDKEPWEGRRRWTTTWSSVRAQSHKSCNVNDTISALRVPCSVEFSDLKILSNRFEDIRVCLSFHHQVRSRPS